MNTVTIKALTNDKTLRVGIAPGATFRTLFSMTEVKSFFGDVDSSVILMGLESIDGSSVASIRNRISDVAVSLSAVIEVDLAGMDIVVVAAPVAAASSTSTAGVVTVMVAGGMVTKSMAIIIGESTVGDIVLSDKIKAVAGKTESEIRACRILIGGVEASMETVLNPGDSIVLEPRVAGCKGAGVTTLSIDIEDADGEDKTIALEVVGTATISDVLAYINGHNMMERPVGSENIVALNNDDVAFLGSRILSVAVSNDDTIGFDSLFVEAIQAEDEDDNREGTDDDDNSYSAAPVSTPVLGTVTVVLQAGMTSVSVAIVNGETTLRTVLQDRKVLAQSAQSAADIANSRVTINGVEMRNLDVKLNTSEVVRVDARAAGCKG